MYTKYLLIKENDFIKRVFEYDSIIWSNFESLLYTTMIEIFELVTKPRWSRDQTEKQKPSQPHLYSIPQEIDFPNL